MHITKVYINFLQIVAIAAIFPLRWPRSLSGMFHVSSFVSTTGGAVFLSADCILTSTSDIESPFFFRSLLIACVPILVVLVSAAVWFFLAPRYFGATKRRRRFAVSLIVTSFLHHLLLVNSALLMFACTEPMTGSDSRFLKEDTRIVCGGAVHVRWMFLGGFMLAFYAVGIPLVTFGLLFVHRKRLSDVRATYGK